MPLPVDRGPCVPPISALRDRIRAAASKADPLPPSAAIPTAGVPQHQPPEGSAGLNNHACPGPLLLLRAAVGGFHAPKGGGMEWEGQRIRHTSGGPSAWPACTSTAAVLANGGMKGEARGRSRRQYSGAAAVTSVRRSCAPAGGAALRGRFTQTMGWGGRGMTGHT